MIFYLLFSLQDTPANCKPDEFLGLWRFELSKKSFAPTNDQIDCSSFKTGESFEIDFKDSGVAVAYNSNVRSGHWFPVAFQGFELEYNNFKYFIFSNFDENSSYCNQSYSGFAHLSEMKPKLHYCLRATLIKPLNRLFEKIDSIKNSPITTDTSGTKYTEPNNHNLYMGHTLPANFSWKKLGMVPPVFDQGGCGSCFAVASAQAMMARAMVATENNTKLGRTEFLSISHIIDCSLYSQGCDGGFGEQVAKFSEDFGILTTDSYGAYLDEAQECRAVKVDKKGVKRYYFTGYQYLGGRLGGNPTEEAMRWELYRYGAFPVSIFVNPCFSQLLRSSESCYENASYTPDSPIFEDLNGEDLRTGAGRHYYIKKSNHLVLLTGWGEDDEGKYWEIQNSWSEGWGRDGYIKIRRGTNEYNVESAPVIFYYAGDFQRDDSQKTVGVDAVVFNLMIAAVVLLAVALVVLVVLYVWKVCPLCQKKQGVADEAEQFIDSHDL